MFFYGVAVGWTPVSPRCVRANVVLRGDILCFACGYLASYRVLVVGAGVVVGGLLLKVFAMLTLGIRKRDLASAPMIVGREDRVTRFFISGPFLCAVARDGGSCVISVCGSRLRGSEGFAMGGTIFGHRSGVTCNVISLSVSGLAKCSTCDNSLLDRCLFGSSSGVRCMFYAFGGRAANRQCRCVLRGTRIVGRSKRVLNALPMRTIRFCTKCSVLRVSIRLARVNSGCCVIGSRRLGKPISPKRPTCGASC